ncbi:SHOCT domain-containing protein [Streptomyces sp. NPDC005727]|uniref:SHOCT domain-containing protein n=1 Tax=unclassified Streptomyces TaxID=2593676 RepID=UPI00340E81D4
MTTAKRRARLALTLVGLLIAVIGLIIYADADSHSDAADQAAVDASAADWADALGYEASQSAKDERFEAEQAKRVAEEDKTFGLVIAGIGLAVFAARWAVRPAPAASAVPGHAPSAVPPAPVPTPAPAPPASVADELAKLAALRDRGVLSDSEFERQKRQLLDG